MFLNFFWFLGGAQDAEEIPEADGRGRETRTIDGGRGAAVVFDPPPAQSCIWAQVLSVYLVLG